MCTLNHHCLKVNLLKIYLHLIYVSRTKIRKLKISLVMCHFSQIHASSQGNVKLVIIHMYIITNNYINDKMPLQTKGIIIFNRSDETKCLLLPCKASERVAHHESLSTKGQRDPNQGHVITTLQLIGRLKLLIL